MCCYTFTFEIFCKMLFYASKAFLEALIYVIIEYNRMFIQLITLCNIISK